MSSDDPLAGHHTHPVPGVLQVSSDLCINAIADSKVFGGLGHWPFGIRGRGFYFKAVQVLIVAKEYCNVFTDRMYTCTR